jgi:hypothetical protein
MIIDYGLIIVGGASWWLGVCSMALWQNYCAELNKPIAPELMPQQLVMLTDKPKLERPVRVSPFAPKPKQQKPAVRVTRWISEPVTMLPTRKYVGLPDIDWGRS